MRQQLGVPDDWGAPEVGMISWAYDLAVAVNSSAPTAGTLQMVRLKLPQARTITNLHVIVAALGTSLTAGQNFAALFDTSRVRQGITADQTTNWGTLGLRTMALTTPYAAPAGDVYVGFYSRGTTPPSFSRGVNTTAVNGLLATASSRYATADTGLTTTMPTTAAALAAAGTAWWVGVS